MSELSAVQPDLQSDSDATPKQLRIADVAAILGVPIPTLRSWEARYGIPHTARTVGLHRRYSAPEVQALKLMRDEIARGKRAGAAALSVRALLTASGESADFIEDILAASGRLDAVGVRTALAAATDALGLGQCLDDVLMPSMRQIGLWWAAGRCDMQHEHLTTEAARAWLDRLAAFAPEPTHRDPILLACGPGDMHTVGLEAFAALLRYRGWPCRIIGVRMANTSLTMAANATGAAAVVMVSHLPSVRRRAVAAIANLADAGITVFYAGNAFSNPSARKTVKGIYLGDKLEHAAAKIDQALSN